MNKHYSRVLYEQTSKPRTSRFVAIQVIFNVSLLQLLLYISAFQINFVNYIPRTLLYHTMENNIKQNNFLKIRSIHLREYIIYVSKQLLLCKKL